MPEDDISRAQEKLLQARLEAVESALGSYPNWRHGAIAGIAAAVLGGALGFLLSISGKVSWSTAFFMAVIFGAAACFIAAYRPQK